MTDPTLASWLQAAVRPLGFKRRGAAWTSVSRDVSQIITLQKSNFSGQYFLNVGIFLLDLDAPEPPREELAHIRLRANSLLPERDADAVTKLLDSDYPIESEDRKTRLDQTLRGPLLSFLEDSSTRDGLRDLAGRGAFRNAFLHHRAREMLSEHTPSNG